MRFQNVVVMLYYMMDFFKNIQNIKKRIILLLVLVFLFENLPGFSIEMKPPIESESKAISQPSQIDFKNTPNFPNSIKKSTEHMISASATSIPLDTRLRLGVDSPLDARISKLGEYFKAHIIEDFYIPSTPPQLVIPKGSWVRGHISFLKKPTVFSMAGKVGLHLDQLVTPVGEVIPLNAELDIQQGQVNGLGQLDPLTGFNTKALKPTQNLLDSTNGKVISVVALGSPVVGTLVAGSLIALFSQGDNITLTRGQELQIVLKKDIQLTIN